MSQRHRSRESQFLEPDPPVALLRDRQRAPGHRHRARRARVRSTAGCSATTDSTCSYATYKLVDEHGGTVAGRVEQQVVGCGTHRSTKELELSINKWIDTWNETHVHPCGRRAPARSSRTSPHIARLPPPHGTGSWVSSSATRGHVMRGRPPRSREGRGRVDRQGRGGGRPGWPAARRAGRQRQDQVGAAGDVHGLGEDTGHERGQHAADDRRHQRDQNGLAGQPGEEHARGRAHRLQDGEVRVRSRAVT